MPMVEPRTRQSDYMDYRSDMENLECLYLEGSITPEVFANEARATLQRHQRVDPKDIHYFADHKQFSEFIYRQMGVSRESLALLKERYKEFVRIKMRQVGSRFGCAVLLDYKGKKTIDTFVTAEPIADADSAKGKSKSLEEAV